MLSHCINRWQRLKNFHLWGRRALMNGWSASIGQLKMLRAPSLVKLKAEAARALAIRYADVSNRKTASCRLWSFWRILSSRLVEKKKPFMKSFSFYFLRCRFSRSLLIGLRPKMSSSSWSRADDPIPSVDNKIAEIRTRWKLRFCRLNRFRIVGLLARSSNGAALVEKCSLMMVIIQSRGSMERKKIASQCPNRNHERAGSAI